MSPLHLATTLGICSNGASHARGGDGAASKRVGLGTVCAMWGHHTQAAQALTLPLGCWLYVGPHPPQVATLCANWCRRDAGGGTLRPRALRCAAQEGWEGSWGALREQLLHLWPCGMGGIHVEGPHLWKVQHHF